VRARACGLTARDYFGDRSREIDNLPYSGIAEIMVDDAVFQELSFVLHQKRTIPAAEVGKLHKLPQLEPNQCCVFGTGGGKVTLAIYKKNGGENPFFRYVEKPVTNETGRRKGVHPKNIYQAFFHALMSDPTIKIVTADGIAGSGKTLIALLAGLEQLEQGAREGLQQLSADKEIFDEIIAYRPNFELGKELGYLPGTIEEKFDRWARPILDNLNLLERGVLDPSGAAKSPILYDIKTLLKDGKVTVEPINFIQGRTLHRKMVLVDETQNFSPSDVKALVTRAGEGTLFVLTGDPGQIANPYLDRLSNGLTHVINRFRGQEIFGHITLVGSLRSYLAERGAELL